MRSSACDGWQPIEREWRLTHRCCELLLEYGFQVHILTKSGLVLRDLDLFAGRKVQVGVTVTSLDEVLRAHWEPRAASVDERFNVLEAAGRLESQSVSSARRARIVVGRIANPSHFGCGRRPR